MHGSDMIVLYLLGDWMIIA